MKLNKDKCRVLHLKRNNHKHHYRLRLPCWRAAPAHGLNFWVDLCRRKELGSMIIMGPFQLGMFYEKL